MLGSFGSGSMKYIIATVISGIFGLLAIWYKYYLNNDDYVMFDLTNHPLFLRMEELINQIDYSIQFEDEAKCKLVTDVMENYFYVVKDELIKFAKEVEEREKEGITYNVHELHMKSLNNIIIRYTDLRSYEKYNLDDDSQETLKLFISKFQGWHENRVEFLRKRSAEISNSNIYKEDIMKVSVLFDIYVGIMASTLHVGSKTLEKLNGELEDMKYKELIIGGD